MLSLAIQAFLTNEIHLDWILCTVRMDPEFTLSALDPLLSTFVFGKQSTTMWTLSVVIVTIGVHVIVCVD